MSKFVRVRYIERTANEIEAVEKAQAAFELAERSRLPTEEERLEALENAMLELMGVNADG